MCGWNCCRNAQNNGNDDVKKSIYLICAALVVAALLVLVWWRYVPLADGEYVVANETCTWRMQVSNGVLRTVALERRGGERLAVEGVDFMFRLGTAASIGWAPEHQKPHEQYPPLLVRDAITVTPEQCVARRLVRGWRTRTFVLHQPAMNCNVILEFDLGRGAPWLRRRLLLQSCDPARVLATDQAAYHVRWRMPGTHARGGGQGQPIRLDDTWFFGLEHPCGETLMDDGTLVLKQHPGYRFDAEPLALQTMVIGGGERGRARAAVDAYVEHLRRPARSLTLYNTWCDMRGAELTLQGISNASAAIQSKLRQYGAALDVAAIDDGWFVPGSIWECDTNKFPGCMQAAHAAVAVSGARLGLWLPLSGHSLDTSWGGARGFEVASPKYYCMSGTNYNRALRAQLTRLMAGNAIDYFKHDFCFFWCGRTDHGHFPTQAQSTEANVTALLSLLEMEARMNPRIFLAITTGIWPSPWWLPYVDTIWMGGGDHDYNRALPASRGSAFEMNYRDGALYTMLVTRELAFPLSALMTHGVVDGRHTPYSMKQEDDEGWANYVMNYLGRGTLMREFYISPENLSARRWEIMARGIRWARTLDGCMAHAHFILGDPNKGELFGYTGVSNNLRYANLRNPLLSSATVPLGALGISGGVCEVVYPWHMALGGDPAALLEIPDEGVVQVMAAPLAQLDIPVPCGVRAELAASSARSTEYTLHMPEGGGSFALASPVRVRSVSGPGATAHQVTGVWQVVMTDPDVVQRAAAGRVATALAFDEHGVLRGSVHVPRGMLAKLRVVYHYRGGGTPVAQRNGRLAPGESINGDGWRMLTVPCVHGSNEFSVVMQNVHAPLSGVQADAYLISETVLVPYRLRIEHDAVTPRQVLDRPLPLLQDRERRAERVAHAMVALGAASGRARSARVLAESDLARIVRAEVRFDGFDVNGGQYADKRVRVNGVLIGTVPPNPAPLAAWHATAMPLADDARAALKLDNVLTIEDATGDSYKLRDLHIAVTLDDGRTARTADNGMVYSSSLQWAHGEGELLPRDGTPVCTLSF